MWQRIAPFVKAFGVLLQLHVEVASLVPGLTIFHVLSVAETILHGPFSTEVSDARVRQ